MEKLFHKTDFGKLFLSSFEDLYHNYLKRYYSEKFELIITSPPFPLNAKKKYGNFQGEEYKDWFLSLAPIFSNLLSDTGSLVIEIGNSWEPNRPVQSTLHLECLLGLIQNSDLRLIQEFIVYNPSKLPSPAQWVTVNRIRAVDSYTHVWWLAKSDYPKADNRKVLRPYSKSMKQLLKKQQYNSGTRPSEHNVSEKGFLKDNGGSIAHNFFELENLEYNRDVRLPHNVLSFSNTVSNDFFLKTCRERGITPHPARMNQGIVNFFIEFLTNEYDLILDPFGGSNTTGYCAEKLRRRWIVSEVNEKYAKHSLIRFEDPALQTKVKRSRYDISVRENT